MKKPPPSCAECGENKSILTQVSSGPDTIMLCSDCYNLKYLSDAQNVTTHDEKEKS